MISKSTKLIGIATVVTAVFLLAPKTLAVEAPGRLVASRYNTEIVKLRYIILPSEAVTMNVREL